MNKRKIGFVRKIVTLTLLLFTGRLLLSQGGGFLQAILEALGMAAAEKVNKAVTASPAEKLPPTEQQLKEQQKQKLLEDLCGEHKLALAALETLRGLGWLEDGTLRRARLLRSDLHDADFSKAHLSGANVERADLHNINLRGARLQGASMSDADLRNANLNGANLDFAVLRGAKLGGADLSGANLNGAVLEKALFDDKTILPDGSRWTPDSDLTRFTDPKHPNFWRSDDPNSPEYRGGSLHP